MKRGTADATIQPVDDALKAALEEQWRERIDEISRLSVQLYSMRDADDVESDGLGGHALEQSMVERALDAARRAAADIEAALRRVADGTYGVCEACRRPVPPARLDALPYARFCAPCQAAAARP